MVHTELPEGRSIIILWWIIAMEKLSSIYRQPTAHSLSGRSSHLLRTWLIITGTWLKNAYWIFKGRWPEAVWLAYSITAFGIKCVGLAGLLLEMYSISRRVDMKKDRACRSLLNGYGMIVSVCCSKSFSVFPRTSCPAPSSALHSPSGACRHEGDINLIVLKVKRPGMVALRKQLGGNHCYWCGKMI